MKNKLLSKAKEFIDDVSWEVWYQRRQLRFLSTKTYYQRLWKAVKNEREIDYKLISWYLDHNIIRIILEGVKEVMDGHHQHDNSMKTDAKLIIYLCEKILSEEDSDEYINHLDNLDSYLAQNKIDKEKILNDMFHLLTKHRGRWRW